MIWFLLWLYFCGMAAVYAIDAQHFTLFWFTFIILVFWPIWVTIISLWFMFLTVRERKWILT